MTSRSFSHVANHPIDGDIVEITERLKEEIEIFDYGTILRVLAVREGFVWFKEYGEGRKTIHVKYWQERLRAAQCGRLIRGGDYDCPF